MMYEVIEEGNTDRLITDKAGEMNAHMKGYRQHEHINLYNTNTHKKR